MAVSSTKSRRYHEMNKGRLVISVGSRDLVLWGSGDVLGCECCVPLEHIVVLPLLSQPYLSMGRSSLKCSF